MQETVKQIGLSPLPPPPPLPTHRLFLFLSLSRSIFLFEPAFVKVDQETVFGNVLCQHKSIFENRATWQTRISIKFLISLR